MADSKALPTDTFRHFCAGREPASVILSEYIAYLGEWWKSEYKASSHDGDVTIRTAVCALANSKGGEVFVGVTDEREIIGTTMSIQRLGQVLRQGNAVPGLWYITDLTTVVTHTSSILLGADSGRKTAFVLEVSPPGLPVFLAGESGEMELYLRHGDSSDRASSFQALEWSRRMNREDILRTCYLELDTLSKVISERYPGLALGLGLKLPFLSARLEDGTIYRFLTREDLLFLLGEAHGSGYRGGVIRELFEGRHRLEEHLQREGMNTVAAVENLQRILNDAGEGLRRSAESFQDYLRRNGIEVTRP